MSEGQGGTVPDGGGPRDHPHELLGAYLLGGLAAAERAEFESHLDGCAGCAAELGRLAGLTTLLDAVEPADALALTFPPAAVPAGSPAQLLAELGRRRRRSRVRAGGLAAALAAACLALGVYLQPVLVPAPRPDESYSVADSTGLSVDLGLVHKAWGTELTLQAAQLPHEGALSLWVTDRAGHTERVCSWGATPAGRAKITTATALPVPQIASVAVRDAAQRQVALITMPAGS